MSNAPIVTVLICAYNAEKYIADCLNAVINQTYKNLEIIIINDGSTDNTQDILNKISKIDSRIKLVLNKKNIGFINSLNKGLTYSTGKYIAKTDADDITKPEWIEKIVSVMEKEDSILAMGSYMSIISEKDNGSMLSKKASHGDEWRKPLSHSEIIEAMLFYCPMNNPSMIMKTEIYTKYGLKFDPNYLYAEDYKFWLEVSRIGKLANYPESLVYYRLHSNQTSSLHINKQLKTAKKIRKEAINYYLSDLGIKHSLSKKITFKDVLLIQKEEYNISIPNSEIFNQILYDCYFSLDKYNIRELLLFLINKNNFSWKQKRRIIKKFIFPQKYKSIL
ncbi:MAG: glycosyltransferase family 2 protein [Pasteurella oralis]|uniref:glycosyltransferase family 2 protein n=1 Tax=Pasteurella oralis TaxID=1071947 RepID=UPI002706D4A2|nr:glycosyltransferase family 2 protein [Pasteurella oralis]